MRSFADLQETPGIFEYIGSALGTLYIVPAGNESPKRIVRHFDRELSPSLTAAFADLCSATALWLERHPELRRLVRTKPLAEVGTDFVARDFMPFSSTEGYDDIDEPVEPPPELAEMRNLLDAAVGRTADPADAIVESVLTRSLARGAGKTYFDEDNACFVIVEPSMTPEDVRHWHNLGR